MLPIINCSYEIFLTPIDNTLLIFTGFGGFSVSSMSSN